MGREAAAIMSGKSDDQGATATEKAPHYHGHRARLRQRFLDAGSEAVSDYELLELILFRAIPQRDVKPLAKELIATFGSFAEVIAATRLAELKGLGDAAITELKVVQAAASRLARGAVGKRPVLSSWSSVLDYCRTAQASPRRSSSAFSFSTSATPSSPTRCRAQALSTTHRSIRAR
jgi:DNA repair protein RadC